MKYGITYTGGNAHKVIDWAGEYGFTLEGRDYPAPGASFNLSRSTALTDVVYQVEEGHTLLPEEFEKYLAEPSAEPPAAPEPVIVLVTGQAPFGERISGGGIDGEEVLISRRRDRAWKEYQEALRADVAFLVSLRASGMDWKDRNRAEEEYANREPAS